MALTGQLPGDVGAIKEKCAALDDLVIQFGETTEGIAFVDAWFNARKVVDLVRAAKPAAAQSPEPEPKQAGAHSVF